MARLVGVDIPNNKRAEIGLTYIYGVGKKVSNLILEATKIDKNKKVKDLSPEELQRIKEYMDENLRVEGELRTEISMNIKRLIDISCYRGIRHRRGLPVRGQNTHNNSRTRKGPKKTAIKKKKKA